jgi:aspartate racemase
MNNRPVLGIIGGAGVAATNKFNELVEITLTKKGAFRDYHHPVIISYQATAAPSRSMFLEAKGESFIPSYIKVGKQLKNSGATILCMTCNTAHYAINEIQQTVDLPFINLVEEVVKVVKNKGLLRVGIMASNGSIKGKVYDKYFQAIFPEAQIIYPNTSIQRNVTKGIVNIKNKYRFVSKNHPERPNFIFKNICDNLKNQGVEIIISGCTDIRVDFSPKDFSDVEVVDSLEVLSKVVCDSLCIT